MQTRAAVLAVLMLSAAAPAHAQTPAPRAQVMILGTYHMDNPGQDYANATADDVLAPHRQAEMAAVAQALAEFRPTRIAIEAPPSRDSLFNARYAQYRAGTHALGRDEREQLGFRLAGMLGHDRVYPVDYRLDMDVGGVMQYAAQNGQGELAQRMGSTIQTIVADMNARMATTPIGAILAEANSARADSMHGWYMVMATVGRDTTYTGAREVSNWYTRNLHIFANIARVAQPGERVLVIMGSGHGTLLRQFVDESPDLDLVSVEPLLARFTARPASR
ncbi:MAG TPA: DUF5694 domain-containing protein [Longimicrobium sp.]|nr:DUF5694 domain-containing protein [Longimicrobium sp.]